jgi:hypothetical protein
MISGCGALTPEELVAYWAGDLAAAAVDRLDEHLMGCASCSAASARISAVTQALGALVPPFVDHARVASLRALGRRIRENPIQPDERREVVFEADLEFLIHQLGGLDLTNAQNVSVFIKVEETGDVLVYEPSVPFDRDSGEVLIACQRHFAAFPPNVVIEVCARDASGAERLARYPIPHVYEARAGS